MLNGVASTSPVSGLVRRSSIAGHSPSSGISRTSRGGSQLSGDHTE